MKLKLQWNDHDLPACECNNPVDNDQGTCMRCGYWINYTERQSP